MGNDGWIKVWREILNKPKIAKNPKIIALWVHLLLRAAYAKTEEIVRGGTQEIERGQVLFTIESLQRETGLSPMDIRNGLATLKKNGSIFQNATNRYTIITICEYDKYQDSILEIEQTENKRRTNEKQTENKRPSDSLLGIYNKEEVKEDISCAVCDYLNLKAGTRFSPKTAETARHINARIKEGRSLEDFKTVIDKKVADWKGTDYEKFLRPKTLFTPANFESYLNQQGTTKKDPISNRYHNKPKTLEEWGAYAVLEQTDKDGNLL